MEEFKPGDRVNIEIKDAEIVGTRVEGDHLLIRKPWPAVAATFRVNPNHPSVTITRAVPQPQAGDVWRLADGERVMVYGNPARAITPHPTAGPVALVSEFDFTGAELLFRFPPAEPAGPMLRRFRDGEDDEWTETAPGSGRYHIAPCDEDDCECSSGRNEVSRNYGPLTDLDPIPAPAADPKCDVCGNAPEWPGRVNRDRKCHHGRR